MGKLNVAKMANFMEVDVYVLVACPESSLIDNQVMIVIIVIGSIVLMIFWFDNISQDFYKPVVTPFEMEVACSR